MVDITLQTMALVQVGLLACILGMVIVDRLLTRRLKRAMQASDRRSYHKSRVITRPSRKA